MVVNGERGMGLDSWEIRPFERPRWADLITPAEVIFPSGKYAYKYIFSAIFPCSRDENLLNFSFRPSISKGDKKFGYVQQSRSFYCV